DARRRPSGHGERRLLLLGPLGLRQPRYGVAVDFAREVVVGWRGRAAVEADPDAQERIGEAVFLLASGDEVHVLEPREVILGGPRRPLQAMRDLGQRQPFIFREDLEDRFQRAVPARAMQAQLVAVAAFLREPALRREQRRERADRVAAARAAVRSELV